MVRPITHRFTSFLDRFEDRLEVDCEQLKRQLVAQVDQQFGVLRTKVFELRGRFAVCGKRNVILSVHCNDPQVETVSLDKWIEERGAAAEEESFSTASTSTGLKRKSTAKQSQSTNKRQKSGGLTANAGRNKLVCKYAGCGKSFSNDYNLARHERIHLEIKPFSCTWLDCRYSAVRKANVVEHVRMQHFKLPKLQKKQTRLNIVDNRNPQDYIRVDNQLLERRLE